MSCQPRRPRRCQLSVTVVVLWRERVRDVVMWILSSDVALRRCAHSGAGSVRRLGFGSHWGCFVPVVLTAACCSVVRRRRCRRGCCPHPARTRCVLEGHVGPWCGHNPGVVRRKPGRCAGGGVCEPVGASMWVGYQTVVVTTLLCGMCGTPTGPGEGRCAVLPVLQVWVHRRWASVLAEL